MPTPSMHGSSTSQTPSPSASMTGCVHVPLASQVSVVQTWPSSGHGVPAASGVWTHVPPASHASEVQAEPSSAHAPPAPIGVWAQVPAPSHASAVQAFWSSVQAVPAPTAGCVQVPEASHTSLVQTFASLVQALPLGRTWQVLSQQPVACSGPLSHSSVGPTTWSPQQSPPAPTRQPRPLPVGDPMATQVHVMMPPGQLGTVLKTSPLNALPSGLVVATKTAGHG